MIAVEHNASTVQRLLTQAERKQIPFATAVALTRTARDVTAAELKQMRESLTIRNRGLMRKAVQSIKASKRDWPNPEATIYLPEQFDFLADHVTGKIRRGTAGHRRAIPTRLVKRTARGKVRTTQTPKRVLARKKAFVDDEKQAIRAKSGAKGVKNIGGAATWYLLRERVKIDKVWPWERTASVTVAKEYAAHFEREFAAALASKKRKAGKISEGGGRQAYLRARQKQGNLPGSMRQGANYNR